MKLKLTRFHHKGQNCIGLVFPPNKDLELQVKKLPGAKWTQTHRCWYVANKPENLKAIFSTIGKVATIDKDGFFAGSDKSLLPGLSKNKKKAVQLPPLLPGLEDKIKLMETLMRNRRYSESTIKNYLGAIMVFLRWASRPPEHITNDDVHRFNKEYVIGQNLSSSYQNIMLNAIKLFYLKVEHKKIRIEELERPKKEKKLPNVLSKQEVRAILNSLQNIKHKTMLSLIYACGLRRSELLNLKISDIHSKRKLLLIKQSKGRKDRVAPLSEKTINLLREYYKLYKPKDWLFEGQTGGQYSTKSLENVLEKAVKAAGINKPVTLHWLRHSYATHLLESGTDLRYIQEILGHASSRTTEIYTHVSSEGIGKIKSPFDDL